MNRFFSKLDLRDIKIDPQGSHFPPDEDAYEDRTTESPNLTDGNELQENVSSAQPHQSDWTAVPADVGSESAPELLVSAESDVARYGEVLKVSARSRPSAVAGAIAGVVRENGRAEVQAIGAGATNQAVKAVAIARDYLRETGIDAVCLPAFIDVTIDNEDRTAIRLVVEPR